MTEKITFQKAKRSSAANGTTSYGAIKSDNEIYFQMASLFREATKGKRQMSGQMLARILKSKQANTAPILSVYDL